MNSRKLLLASASALAIGSALTQGAFADDCKTAGIITGTCTSTVVLSGPLTITNTGSVSAHTGLLNRSSSSISALTNNGTIAGSWAGVQDTGSIGTVLNAGLITNNVKTNDCCYYGYYSGGTKDVFINSGTITAPSAGLINFGLIKTLTNTATGTISNSRSSSASALINDGTINNLLNAGYILRVDNTAGIGFLSNSGTIGYLRTGNLTYPGGSIGSLSNSGTIGNISYDGVGAVIGSLSNTGTIGTISYNGTISSTGTAINISGFGSVGALAIYGTITGGEYAIYHTGGSIPIITSGVINGNIHSSSPLSIIGGKRWISISSGAMIGLPGTLMGGIITAPVINIGQGEIVLADDVVGTLLNSGGPLDINAPVKVTGDYIQNSGTLALGSAGALSVTGAANISAGVFVVSSTVAPTFSSTGNYTANTPLLTLIDSGTAKVSGAGVRFVDANGTIVNAVGIPGLSMGLMAANGDVVLGVANDYVGGTLDSITNTGTISAATGVYVASTGSLGTLSNSGVIAATTGTAPYGVVNNGVIGTIVNDGTLVGGTYYGGTYLYAGIRNAGSIGGITNNGVMRGLLNDVVYGSISIVQSTLGSFINTGTVLGDPAALSFAPSSGSAYNLGIIGSMLNQGTIGAIGTGSGFTNGVAGTQVTIDGTPTYVWAPGVINDVRNEGTIYALTNHGTIHALTNTGALLANRSDWSGLFNSGVIDTVVNSGTIESAANSYGWWSGYDSATRTYYISRFQNGNIGLFDNSGTLGKLDNSGTIGTLTNSGAIAGTNYGISNFVYLAGFTVGGSDPSQPGTFVSAGVSAGSIDTLINTGVISGIRAIENYSSKDGSAYIGLLDNEGAILSTLSGTMQGEGYGIDNGRGTIATLTNNGTIAAERGIYNNQGTIGALENTGTIAGSTNSSDAWGVDDCGLISTLTNSGMISAIGKNGSVAIDTDLGGTIGYLNNTGVIVASASSDEAWAITNWGGTIATLVNSGTILASGSLAQAVQNDDYMGALTNNGLVSAIGSNNAYAYEGRGKAVLDNLTNVGTMSAMAKDMAYGIYLSGQCGSVCGSTIGSLNNSGTISAAANSAIVIFNGAGSSIGTLVNDGAIKIVGTPGATGPQYDIVNTGSIGSLTNNGVIGGDALIGIENIGVGASLAGTVYQQNYTISTLINAGTITGSNIAISNGGQIDILTNTGMVAAAGDSAVRGLYNSGIITTLTNGGVITATGSDALGLWNDRGSITSFVNSGSVLAGSGTVVGGATGIWNFGGSIGSLTNSGTVAANGSGNSYGLDNSNSGTLVAIIDTLTNGGAIAVSGKSSAAIYNEAGAVITKLANTGVLAADPADTSSYAIQSRGTIGAITNSGTIQGVNAIYSSGTLGTITNSGVISGNVTSATDLVIAGGTTAAGTFKNGVITAPSVSFTGGSLTLADNIAVGNGSGTVTNAGATLNVASAVSISGNYTQTSGALQLIGNGELLVSGKANLSGGTVGLSSTANYLAGSTVTLVGAASGSSYNGVSVTLTGVNATADTTSTKDLVITVANNYVGGTIGTLANDGTLNSGTVGGIVVGQTGTVTGASNAGTIVSDNIGVDNSGQLGTLTNTGVLSSGSVGVGNAGSIGTIANAGTITGATTVVSNTGTLGTLANGGVLTGAGIGVGNAGSIASLANSGTIIGGETVVDNSGSLGSFSNGGVLTGSGTGLSNTGSIGTIGNTGTIAMSGGAFGLNNAGTVGGVTNDGTISGGDRDVYNQGTMGSLVNNGHIGSKYAVYVDSLGSLGQFVNGGNIEGTIAAFYNAGIVDTVANSGTITGDGLDAIYNSGTLGQITNSGTITSVNNAIRSTGVLGPIVNSGLIVGNISTANPLSVSGGTGATGTFTGGTITAANVNFTSGALLLNDAVVGDVVNSGAGLQIGAAAASITGGYAQTAGTLDLSSVGVLTVSGAASVTGGTVVGAAAATGNYLAGDNQVLIHAGAASTSGSVVVNLGIPQLATQAAVSGTDFVATYLNDYVGGSLASVTNAGSISGNAYGLYVAAGGNLGTLVNNGALAGTSYAIYSVGSLGSIVDNGAISGNVFASGPLAISAVTNGTLTGGVITAPTVTFTSGTLAMGDAVAGNAINSGATLLLTSGAAFNGNYTQASGTLDLHNVGPVTVGGTASITGGTVAANLATDGNYIVGQGSALIHAAAGSSYSGVAINILNLPVVAAATTGANGDLVASFATDYVGGSLASVANTGAVSGHNYAVYVAASANLAALNNTGTLSGSSYAIYSAGNLGGITNAGVISGNIASANALAISGGSSGFGTFTGGTITAPSVTFAAGSIRLADAVNVGKGAVSNSGATLEVSDRIAITGNYMQTGGALISDVTSPTAYGQLAVSGSATVTGATITLSGSTVKSGQSYTIIDAAAASQYSGDTVKIVGSHYKAILSATSDDLIATIRPLFSDIGKLKGGDAQTMGAVLEGLDNVTAMQKSIDTLSNLSDGDLGVALVQAAPAQVGNSQTTLRRAVLASGLIGDAINRHIDLNASGSSVWLSAVGGYASRDATGGTQAYDTTVVGVVAGLDHLAAEGLRFGVAASWTDAWTGADGEVAANSNRSTAYQLTGYVAWSDGAWSLNSRALVGYDTYRQRRVMSYVGETASGDYVGYHYGLSAEGGYDYKLGNLSITPTLGFDWLRVTVNSYTETGANADNLSLPSYFSDNIEGLLGFKFASTYASQFGTLQPEIKLFWVHDFVGGKTATRASLGGMSFETLSDAIAKDGVKIGAGLNLFNDSGISVRVGYDGDIRRDYRAHTGDIQIQYRF